MPPVFSSSSSWARAGAPALAAAAILAASVAPTLSYGETLVAAQTIRPGTVLEARHLTILPAAAPPGVLEELEEAIGQEARVSLFQGRPIREGDLAPPRLVKRNDLVTINFVRGGLRLRTEGRALDDGAFGDRVRVMNIDSRLTVYGRVAGPMKVDVN
ncbi:MAG: flagellar basal body P-ring formation chaperone FlgA [Pseudomonadota bacterium]